MEFDDESIDAELRSPSIVQANEQPNSAELLPVDGEYKLVDNDSLVVEEKESQSIEQSSTLLEEKCISQSPALSPIAFEYDIKQIEAQKNKILAFCIELCEYNCGQMLDYFMANFERQELNDFQELLNSKELLTEEIVKYLVNNREVQINSFYLDLVNCKEFKEIFFTFSLLLLSEKKTISQYQQAYLKSVIKLVDLNPILLQCENKDFNFKLATFFAYAQEITLPEVYTELDQEPESELEQLDSVEIIAYMKSLIYDYSLALCAELYGTEHYFSAVSFVKDEIEFEMLKFIELGYIKMRISTKRDAKCILKIFEKDALASAAFVIRKVGEEAAARGSMNEQE